MGIEVIDGGIFVSKPRALVTGANGFMGTYMVDLLLEEGYEVLATDIGPSSVRPYARDNAAFVYRQCDLRDRASIEQMLSGTSFRAVFHIAGLFNYSASWDDLYAANVEGTRNLLDCLAAPAFRKEPPRFIMWGAAGIYHFAESGSNGVREDATKNPKGGYLRTKHAAETVALNFCARSKIPVTVIRPGGVYGPRSRYGVATSIFMAARGGMGPFYFGPKHTRAGMVHAEDVCRAALFLSQHPDAVGEAYNVNDDSRYRTVELMRAAAKRFGFPLVPGAYPLAIMRFFIGNLMKKAAKKGRVSVLNEEMTGLVAYDTLLDARKLKALGWKPKWPDSIEGLMATIDWYEKEGWL